MIASNRFFQQPTVQLAKALLGTFLMHKTAEGEAGGRIVETEAYLYEGDPACHAHRGMTKRNAAMFGPAGIAYIYLIYGMHYCFNVVSGEPGRGEAVLIRALEPIKGIDLMKKRRRKDALWDLCSGPAKLVQALAIPAEANAACLRTGKIRILTRDSYHEMAAVSAKPKVVCTTRIGISAGAELPLRFFIKDNEFVSRP